MADPLSIAGLVLGIMPLAETAYHRLSKLVRSAKNADKEVKGLLREVSLLIGALHAISNLAQVLELEELEQKPIHDMRESQIEACQCTLDEINKVLEKLEDNSFKKKIEWPFWKSRILELQDAISRHKTNINLALTANSLGSLLQMICIQQDFHSKTLEAIEEAKKTLDTVSRLHLESKPTETLEETKKTQKLVNRILQDSKSLEVLEESKKTREMVALMQQTLKRRETLEEMKAIRQIVTCIDLGAKDSERRNILKFFQEYSPQGHYEKSLDLRHPGTGSWLLRKPEFKAWLSNPSSIWFSGIPGAGKTVLAGTIIEESLRQGTGDFATMFFFCDYKDDKTKNPVILLSTLAAQLAVQKEESYSRLERYFQELHPEHGLQRRPTVSGLQAVLIDMVKLFSHVYLVVDGIDECGENVDDILDALLEIVTASKNISTAFLSRDEHDIRTHLSGTFKGLEIAAPAEDISGFVIAEIEKRTRAGRLEIDDPSLKIEIQERLAEKAEGMFRWAACQLDELENCMSDQQCREALDQLPSGLNETYTRILLRVPARKTPMVQKVLNFIAYAKPKLTIQQLREALSVPERINSKFVLDAHGIIRESAIIKLCSSLIRKSKDDDHLEFAHFSVQEFLESDMKSSTRLHSFQISQKTCDHLLAIQCLSYLQVKNFDIWPNTNAELDRIRKDPPEKYPLYPYAARFWLRFARASWDDEHLISSARSLFDPRKSRNFMSWSVHLVFAVAFTYHVFFTYKDSSNSNTELEDLCTEIISHLTHPDFTPLHMATILALPKVSSALLETQTNAISKTNIPTTKPCPVPGLHIASLHWTANGGLLPFCGTHLDSYAQSKFTNTSQAPANGAITGCLLKPGSIQYDSCSNPFSIAPQTLSKAPTSLQESWDYEADYRLSIAILAAVCVKDSKRSYFNNTVEDWKRVYFSFDAKASHILERNLHSLSGMIEKSPIHLGLCKSAWAKAVNFDCPFAFDPLVVDSGICLSDEALKDKLFTSIRNNNFETLQSVLKDPRIDPAEIIDPYGDSPITFALCHVDENNEGFNIIQELLKAGFSVSRPSKSMKNRLPVHTLAEFGLVWKGAEHQVGEIIREFSRRGSGCHIRNEDGQTALHIGSHSTTIINAFLEFDTSENVKAALETQDNQGYTPASFALSEGREGAALLLMQKSQYRLETLRSPVPLLPLCVKYGLSKAFNSIRDIGVDSINADAPTGTLLHHVGHTMTKDFLDELQKLYPDACRIRFKGRFPWTVYLEDCILHGDIELNTDILESLVLPILHGPVAQDKQSVWKDLTLLIGDTKISPIAEEEGRVTSIIESAATCLQVLDSMKSYEDLTQQSGLLCMLEPFKDRLDMVWPLSAPTVLDALGRTKIWTDISDMPAMVQLLKMAVRSRSVETVKILLEKGVSVHQRTDRISTLEMACIRTSSTKDEKEIFKLLLDHSDNSLLDELNPNDYQGLIHYVAGPNKQWQVEELLARGANPNLRRTDLVTGNSLTALQYHLEKRGFDGALVLLKGGADPTKGDIWTGDAALVAALVGATTFLIELHKMSSSHWTVDWNKSCTRSYSMGNKKSQEYASVSGTTALHLAAHGSHIEVLRFYLGNKLLTDINAADEEGFTAMHLAAESGHLDVVTLLYDQGVAIDTKTANGSLPLHLAVIYEHEGVVSFLFDRNRDLALDGIGLSPLAYAYRLKNQVIIDCLQQGQNLPRNILSPGQASKHYTGDFLNAFGKALVEQNMKLCDEFVSQGFSLDTVLPGYNNWSPLFLAIREEKIMPVEWLLSHGAVTTRYDWFGDRQISSLLAISSSPKLAGCMAKFLEKYELDGGCILDEQDSPVLAAIVKENDIGLRLLLEHEKKKYSAQCNTSSIPLDRRAANQGNKETKPMHHACWHGNFEVVKLLLESGAEINSFNDGNETPLQVAARSRPSAASAQIIEFLIKQGANIESRDIFGWTPLISASNIGNLDAVVALVDHGADVGAQNYLLKTPFHYAAAAKEQRTFSFFFHYGLDIHRLDMDHVTPFHIRLVHKDASPSLLLNLDINYEDSAPIPWNIGEWRAFDLHTFLSKSFPLYLRKLGPRTFGKIVNLESRDPWSPLCLAATQGQTLAMENMIRLGARLEFEGCPSGTALIAACAVGRLESVKFLIRRGSLMAYESPGGFRSAIVTARSFKNIVDWMLVGRYTEQAKLSNYDATTLSDNITDEPKYWSGISKAELPVTGILERHVRESAKEYWIRLVAEKRNWRGKVVPIGRTGIWRTVRASKLVPEEYVRICPGDYGTSKEEGDEHYSSSGSGVRLDGTKENTKG